MLGSAPRQEGDRRWGLVHKQPVEMKLLDGLPELLKIHWLLDIAVHAPVISKRDRKSTRLNSSHRCTSYAVFCLKKKKQQPAAPPRRTTPPQPAHGRTASHVPTLHRARA